MSKEFCQKGYNKADITTAVRQEEHLSYIINSDLEQTELTTEYLKNWAERQYQTNDHFLNYIKSIFKTNNFLLFAKFLRKPLPSAKIVNTKIRPQLERVFMAEDADTRYNISGNPDQNFKDLLNVNEFNHDVFDAYLIAHNSIVITEVSSDEANKPFRWLVRIKDVASIEEDEDGSIKKIAIRSSMEIEEKDVKGYLYIDDKMYAFYPFEDKIIPLEAKHDLGYCPAHFITPKRFKGNFVIRESMFTFMREELEDYNVLKTLLKMVMPKGVIPITTKLKASTNNKEEGNKGNNVIDPKIEGLMGSQQASEYASNPPSGSGILDAGSVYDVPPIEKQDGSIDMEAVKSFINFHYLPVDPLTFLTEQIDKKEKAIIGALVGDLIESAQEQSKNMLQIERSNAILDNTLTSLGNNIAYVRKRSDSDMLNIMYGKERVKDVFVFMGSDFMIDSLSMLYDNLAKAPNAIERENILRRISQNRYKNNPYQKSRNNILYDLIPFVSDVDFDKGKDSQVIDELTIKLQLQFNYWIGRFESIYGDIVEFYVNMGSEKSEKTQFIKSLILNIIKDESSTPANQSGNLD